MPPMMAEYEPEPAVVEHLAYQQPCPRCHALARAARGGAAAGDGGGDVGAVAVAVVRGGLVGEVAYFAELPGQVGVGGVDAGVQDGDGRAVSVVAGLPRLGRTDLRGAAIEGGMDLRVQPQLLDAALEGRVLERGVLERGVLGRRVLGSVLRAALGAAPGERVVVDGLPEAPGLLLVRLQCRAAQALDDQALARTGGRPFGRGVRAAGVAGDQRDGGGVGVVVPLLDQGGDVEQLPVQFAGGDVRERGARQHVQLLVDLQLGEVGLRSARGRLDGDGLPAAGEGLQPHPVTGHERDGADLGTAAWSSRRRRRAPGRRSRRRRWGPRWR